MSTMCLPIIGDVRPTPGRPDSYTATKPITVAQLRQVTKAEWCRKVNATDGSNSGEDQGTYYALVELDGQVLVVTGEFTGVR
ncbi:hypothetical protein ACIHEI_14295 [Kitasatospora sp. NPDC051984]|uniref:hypothetical protein n=1 Tax=Kitasatospora sp. NPDC051984 TaxID=3364059 RepID=UPI0037C81355